MSPDSFDASSVVHFRSSLQSIHDVFISRLLTVTFTTAAFRTEAAYGCLKPAPTSRLRRAFLHLRHSTVFSEHVLGTTNPRNRLWFGPSASMTGRGARAIATAPSSWTWNATGWWTCCRTGKPTRLPS